MALDGLRVGLGGSGWVQGEFRAACFVCLGLRGVQRGPRSACLSKSCPNALQIVCNSLRDFWLECGISTKK